MRYLKELGPLKNMRSAIVIDLKIFLFGFLIRFEDGQVNVEIKIRRKDYLEGLV